MARSTAEVETDTMVLFWGGSFSNWCHSPFEYKGMQFENAEAAMMYEKANLFGDKVAIAEIFKDQEPSRVKAIGKRVKNYDDDAWAKIRLDIVIDILCHKFGQNAAKKAELLGTGSKLIVEASPKDKIWGIGLIYNDPRALDQSMWLGQNLLGQALMQCRHLLLLNDGIGEI